MRFASLFLLLFSLVHAQQPTPAPEASDPLTALRELPRKADVATKLKALRGVATLEDAKVVAAVQKLAHDGDVAVRKLVVQVLRFSPAAGAEQALVALASDHEVKQDLEVLPDVLIALGQRDNPKMASLLAADLTDMRKGLFQARVSSLAHIRCKASIDALVHSMALGLGGHTRNPELDQTLKATNIALTLLTNQDFESEGEWRKWWKSAASSFVIPASPTFKTEELEKRWKKMWTNPAELEARKAQKPDKGD